MPSICENRGLAGLSVPYFREIKCTLGRRSRCESERGATLAWHGTVRHATVWYAFVRCGADPAIDIACRNDLHYQLVAIGLLPRVIDYTVHIYSVQECLALSVGSNLPSATRH